MPSAQQIRVPHPSRFCISRWVGIERSSTALLLLAISLAAAMLYRFPPERYSFYPRCPIHEYLHILCPGCGATGAVSALLHGNLTAALRFNAFAILVLLPVAAIYAFICLGRFRTDGLFLWPTTPRTVTIVLAVVAAAFTLFRNL